MKIKLVDTFEKHKNEPEISLNEHTSAVKLRLGNDLKNRIKIYLDTKYWIHLREVIFERNSNPIYESILNLLREGVEKKNIVCPISDEIFSEILLQTNPANLEASAKLIDELSEGVTILSSREREKYEILDFIYKHTDLAGSTHEQDEFVWSKVSFTFGLTHPKLQCVSKEEELLIQKSFFDQMWSMTFSQMIEVIGHENILSWPRCRDFSKELTGGKFDHIKENQSFKQLHLEEIVGVLDIYRPILEEAMVYLYTTRSGQIPTLEELTTANTGQTLANLIYHDFRKNKLGNCLPSLIIETGLHALVRYDTDRKFKKNDLPDFRHAKSALPYYDLFLTENSLRHHLISGKLRFDKKYDCKVYSTPQDAAKYLEKILS